MEQEYERRNAARIGSSVARALTYRDSGRLDDYAEYVKRLLWELDNLIDGAGQEEFIEVAYALEAEIYPVDRSLPLHN